MFIDIVYGLFLSVVCLGGTIAAFELIDYIRNRKW
jgi:hypothetical protein